MQVADSTQKAASATLGARETKAVTMVEDAAFFMMLSSNLYSNQTLAVVREILCNAHDAHIDAGTTDIPISITITKDLDLVIMDSGLGIPDDMMDVVYGTYGSSTKKNDSKTTGGFGLGSKAPWAYAESFRVISEHAGQKTVYNMAKSCIENNGKPGIIPVLTIPTERSGLTVIMRLEEDDVEEFTKYIRMIVRHGEMNATFENEYMDREEFKLKRLGMDSAPGSYNLNYDEWYDPYMGNHEIFIRYGAVVYPALRTPATEKALNIISGFMEVVGYKRILVQAAPDSLALTPSREALSSQKMTENGIVDICVDLVDRIEAEIKNNLPKVMEDLCERLRMKDYISELGRSVDYWSFVVNNTFRRYLLSNLGKESREHYLPILTKAWKQGVRKTVSKYPSEQAKFLWKMHKHETLRRRRKHIYWGSLFAQQYVVKPIAKVICNNLTLLRPKNLRLIHKAYWEHKLTNEFSEGLRDFPVLLEMANRKIVFLTSRLKEVYESVKYYPGIGSEVYTWVYKVAPSGKETAAVAKAFEDAGYEVVDLTANNSWDLYGQKLIRERKERSVKVAVKKAKGIQPKNLLYSIENVYDAKKGKRVFSREQILRSGANGKSTDNPLFYVTVHQLEISGKIGEFIHFLDLSQEEKERGIIIRNGTELRMATKRGALPANEYFVRHFVDNVTKPEFAKYLIKQRKPSIAEIYGIKSADLKILRLLGVKLSGYDKLSYNPVFERWIRILANTYFGNVDWLKEFITPEETDKILEIQKLELEDLPFLKKIRAMKGDIIFRRLGRSKGVLELIQQFPERKSALKSLVNSALKNGIQTNDSEDSD